MFALTNFSRRIEDQHRAREEAHQRQLNAVKQEANKAAEAIHAEHRSKEAELQRQLDYIRKTAETEKERVQRRFEGERADLKATIARLEAAETEAARHQRRTEAEKADLQASLSRLEVDLMKVCHLAIPSRGCIADDKQANKASKTNAEALQTVRDESASKLSTAESKAKAAEDQASSLETQLRHRDEELEKVWTATNCFARTGCTNGGKQQLRKQMKQKEEEKAATQTELDDLLMVFGDLEEKVEKYNVSGRAFHLETYSLSR